MIKATLESIRDFLQTQELDGEIVYKSEEVPMDQLYVSLGLDEQDRDLLIQINLIEQDLSGHDQFFKTKVKPKSYQLIQFYMALPFQVLEEETFETAQAILLVNKSLLLPGFEFSEVDHTIYYRQMIMTSEGQLDERILLQVIGAIAEYTESFSDIFEDIGTGKKSLVEIMKELSEE